MNDDLKFFYDSIDVAYEKRKSFWLGFIVSAVTTLAVVASLFLYVVS